MGAFVAEMSATAQLTRVYAEYLGATQTADPAQIEYLVGPRNRIDKIVGRLPLLP